jgi:hypothetical protein
VNGDAEHKNMRKRRKSPSVSRLAVLARMRATKVRKRLARIAAGWTPEPPHRRRPRWLEVAFRDGQTGESTGYMSVKSAREAARWTGILLRSWQSTPKQFVRQLDPVAT